MEIRPAREGDAEEVARLFAELGYPQSPDPERLEAWDADPHGHALVADAGDHLAGVVAVHLCPYFAQPGRYARIASLVVDARHRERGVGRGLMDAAHRLARDAGCVAAEVTSGRRRDASHPFYRSLGYEDLTEKSVRYMRDL